MLPILNRCHYQLLIGVALLAGCGVPQATYDAALSDANKEKGRSAELDKQLSDAKAEIDRLSSEKANAEQDAQTKAELEGLRKQKAAAEARLKTFDELSARFRKLIDSGKLELTVRHGQIVLALETDVLFDPGKTEIKAEGKAALKEVAEAVRTVLGRRFQVAGHTDTAPIKTKEYPSNWELSTARAVVVVKLLVAEGVKSTALSAAGYAEFDALANNGTEPGRAKNRRIEIVLVPNLDEILGIEELTSKQAAAKKPTKPTPPPQVKTAPSKPPAGKPAQPKTAPKK